MATRFLCYLVLCFLRAGEFPEIKNLQLLIIACHGYNYVLYSLFCFFLELTNAGVIQTPRHKVTGKGQEVTLRCEPISGHSAVFWYRQSTVKGLELLIYFNNQAPIDDSGMPKERFSAQMPNQRLSTLKIQTTQPQDSAVYLCASSLDTELQTHILPRQKPNSSSSRSTSKKLFLTVILRFFSQQEVYGFNAVSGPRQDRNRW